MATYYWVSGGNGLWSSSSNWSLSSGGTGGAGVPSTSDTAVFDGNSPNVTLNTSPTIGVLNASAFDSKIFNFVTYSITLTGSGTVLSGNYYMILKCSTGYTPTIYLTNPTNAALRTEWFALGWVNDIIGHEISTAANIVFPSGTYALTLSGLFQDVDFMTNSYSGVVNFGTNGATDSCSFYGTFKFSSTMSCAGFTGFGLFANGKNCALLSNGVYVETEVYISEYFQGTPSLTLLDALSTISVKAYDGPFNMNGKNVTTAGPYPGAINTIANSISFGSGNPTFTTNIPVQFSGNASCSGQGTATFAYTGSGGGLSASNANLTIPATINQAGSGTMTISKGAYLNIRNTAYGTVKFTGPVRFVDFSLKGTAGTPLVVQGTVAGTAVSKVDPWYVGPNSTDAGGNTGILFSGNEGSDYLTVSNLSGTYNYGPHFMAFM